MNQQLLTALELASEAVVLAEVSDVKALADLHTRLEEVAAAAVEAGVAVVPEAARASAGLLEAIILNDIDDPAAAFEAVGEALGAMQVIGRDGRDPSEVCFPARLGLSASASPAPAVEAAEVAVAAPELPTETALQGDLSLLGDFVTEAREHLENADVHLLTLETDPHNDEALNAVFRAFHTIKGVAGFLALDEVQRLAHEAENLLDLARKGTLKLGGAAIDTSFEAVDMLKRLVGHVETALAADGRMPREQALPALLARLQAAAADELAEAPVAPAPAGGKLGEILVTTGAATADAVERALQAQHEPVAPPKLGDVLCEASLTSRAQVEEALEIQQQSPERGKLGEILVEIGAVRPGDVEDALQKQQKPEAPRLGELLVRSGEAAAQDVARALRTQNAAAVDAVKELVKVDADRLDRLVDLIGELVIAESMVSQSPELRTGSCVSVLRHVNQLDKITRALQEMGTSLRMVPIRSTFQKMARLARDVAKKAGKPVEFVTAGEDTELDKTVVDKIGDPLIHMVRNAVDHGLERSAGDRRAAGKPDAGRVELRAYHKGGGIYIEIEDDGRGLDRDAILAKAVERGLIREGDNLSDREVWDLIFQPGFSTAKQVTDVSGRGVGMDVVKRNIDALRGQIEIRTEKGKGTVFSVRLPLTLAIIDGMVVGIGAERYVLPTLSIVRSIRPQPEDITTVVGRGEMLVQHGALLPVFRLSRLFGRASTESLTERLIVVAENDGRQVGLAVDALLGQQQIVIKPLGEGLSTAPGIAGGAVMPDGQVGLILDVAGLIRMAHEGEGACGPEWNRLEPGLCEATA